MNKIETEEKDRDIVLKNRYRKLSKVVFILAIIYLIWVSFVIISIYFLEMGYRWALLSIDEWVYVGIVLLAIFIVLELIFFLHYHSAVKEKIEGKKPKPEFYKGKRVHVYTYPSHAKGGLFSKTYIPIDDKNILRVRTNMISAENLWKKKEK